MYYEHSKSEGQASQMRIFLKHLHFACSPHFRILFVSSKRKEQQVLCSTKCGYPVNAHTLVLSEGVEFSGAKGWSLAESRGGV